MEVTLKSIMRLRPCYPYGRVRRLFKKGFTRETLLGIPEADAFWVLSGLLSPDKRVTWTKKCALIVATERVPRTVRNWLAGSSRNLTGRELQELIVLAINNTRGFHPEADAAYYSLRSAQQRFHMDDPQSAVFLTASTSVGYSCSSGLPPEKAIGLALSLLKRQAPQR